MITARTSTDIVQRLRATGGKGQSGPIRAEAADEIERLRSALEALTDRAFRRCLFPVEVKAAFAALDSTPIATDSYLNRIPFFVSAEAEFTKFSAGPSYISFSKPIPIKPGWHRFAIVDGDMTLEPCDAPWGTR